MFGFMVPFEDARKYTRMACNLRRDEASCAAVAESPRRRSDRGARHTIEVNGGILLLGAKVDTEGAAKSETLKHLNRCCTDEHAHYHTAPRDRLFGDRCFLACVLEELEYFNHSPDPEIQRAVQQTLRIQLSKGDWGHDKILDALDIIFHGVLSEDAWVYETSCHGLHELLLHNRGSFPDAAAIEIIQVLGRAILDGCNHRQHLAMVNSLSVKEVESLLDNEFHWSFPPLPSSVMRARSDSNAKRFEAIFNFSILVASSHNELLLKPAESLLMEVLKHDDYKFNDDRIEDSLRIADEWIQDDHCQLVKNATLIWHAIIVDIDKEISYRAIERLTQSLKHANEIIQGEARRTVKKICKSRNKEQTIDHIFPQLQGWVNSDCPITCIAAQETLKVLVPFLQTSQKEDAVSLVMQGLVHENYDVHLASCYLMQDIIRRSDSPLNGSKIREAANKIIAERGLLRLLD